jgi:hypothetical protein
LALPAFGEVPTTVLPPEGTGVVVAAVDPERQEDLRLGYLSARLVHRGLESCVAANLARPRVDAEVLIGSARQRLNDARAAFDSGRWADAAASYDEAIALLEKNIFLGQHLSILLEALVERGSTAIKKNDSAGAEAFFSRAARLSASFQPTGRRIDDDALSVYRAVKEALSSMTQGKLTVSVPGLEGASVAIDFSDPLPSPFTLPLSAGGHFVSVTAPDRSDVVIPVVVSAAREVELYVRPPLAGDLLDRTRAFSNFKPQDPGAEARLINAAGLRFLLLVAFKESALELELHDRTGAPIAGANSKLSTSPSDAETDAAIETLLQAASTLEPVLARTAPGASHEGWYGTWWGISILGAAALGVVAGGVALITRPIPTDYTFRPK